MKNAWFAMIGSLFLLASVLSLGCGTASSRVRTIEVTVLVPADAQEYWEMITGEQNFKKAAELPFVKKRVLVPYSRDVIRASAAAAVKEMPGQDAGAAITYLKVEKGTAYVVLYSDGWAGVSFWWAAVQPVVEKTLLQFKEIKRVVWDEALGEKQPR
jgi:hypothetical protein